MIFFVTFFGFLFKLFSSDSLYKAYIINLPNRPERLQSIVNQLKFNGIPFIVERAISPTDIEMETQLRRSNLKSGLFDPKTELDFFTVESSKLKKTEIACSQSHLQALFKIASSNTSDPVLILEDDASLEPDFYQRTMEIFNSLTESWDILHVGYCFDKPRTCQSKTIHSNYCKKTSGHVLACLHAYFVHGSRAANKILDTLNTPHPVIIDQKMSRTTSNYYISLPRLAKQFPFPSDNDNVIDQWKLDL
jgi:GR25 family glycosyltransferase involved in LPS biosynthesis